MRVQNLTCLILASFSLISLIGAQSAFADRVVKETDSSTFNQLTAADLNTNTLVYSKIPVEEFPMWRVHNPADGALLGLYPDYVEPNVVFQKDGQPTTVFEPLVIYETKVKTVLNVPSAMIAAKLPGMVTLQKIEQLDATVKHKVISRDELIQNVVGQKPVTNFDWCGAGNIERPKKEVDLSHLKSHDFCQNTPNSLCVESCYIFGPEWRTGLTVAIAMSGAKDMLDSKISGEKKESDRKDYGIAFQSEARYFESEAQYGNATPLSELTHIATPVRGILEQNMFYFNQIFQYGKVLVVFQDDPQDPNKTIVTNFGVLGIKARSWSKYGSVMPEILDGTSIFNMGEGLTLGVPNFAQSMAGQTARMMEQ